MALAEQLNDIFARTITAEKFSGAVLIKRNQIELFTRTSGYANRSWKVSNQIDTRFRIASISKMFTAVAILQLIEAKKLAFDTRVVDYLGLGVTQIPKNATIYHMLTMTSGIADWFDESGDWEENWEALCRKHPIYLFRRDQDYLPLFINLAPNASVGEKHQYNGAGFILLGLVIEKASGHSYFDYVRQNIFKRAGMMESDFLPLDGVAGQVAEGYIPVKDPDDEVIDWKKNIYSITPEAAADGGATSIVADLSLFIKALRSNQLLSAQMTDEMLTPKVLEEEASSRGYIWKYGYGCHFLCDPAGRILRWGHTGEEDGVSCRLYYYPEENIEVIILGNQSWSAGSLAWEIHDLLLGKNFDHNEGR